MSDRIKIELPEDEGQGFIDGLSTDQFFNMVRGINRSKDGLGQVLEQVKEGLGITPAGSARHFTEQAILDQQLLEDATASAAELPGATGLLSFETLGEALPFVLTPLGRTFTSGGSIGGAIAGTAFQEDVDDSRLPQIAGGVALGGGLARLFSRGNSPRQAGLADELDALPSPRAALPSPGRPSPQGSIPRKRALVPQGSLQRAESAQLRGDLLKANRSAAKSKVIKAQEEATEGLSRVQAAKQRLATTFGNKAAVEALERTETRLRQDLQGLNVIRGQIDSSAEDFSPKLTAEGQGQGVLLPEEPVLRTAPGEGQGVLVPDSAPAPVRQPGTDLVPTQSPAPQAAPQPANALVPASQGQGTGALGRGQTGSVDPALLAGAAAGGIGGGVATEGDPLGVIGGAALGAVALPALLRSRGSDKTNRFKSQETMRKSSGDSGEFNEAVLRNTSERNFGTDTISETFAAGKKVLDDFLGSIDTRLQALHAPIATALRKSDFAAHSNAGRWMSEGEDFFNAVNDLDLTDIEMRRLKQILLTDRKKAESFLRARGKNGTADKLAALGTTLDDVGEYLKDVGMGVNLLKNYFPRQVIDASKFESIPEINTYFEHLMRKRGVSSLSDFDKENAISDLLNDALSRGADDTVFGRAASSLKRRKQNRVTDDVLDAYADPRQAFNNYIEEVTRQVERQRFFKGQGVNSAVQANAENIDNVVDILKKGLKDQALKAEDIDEIGEIIRMRFGPGERAPSRWVQNFKNLTYTGLLGNPISAMTQFGDVALSAYRNGIGNTTASLVKILANRNRPLSNGLDKDTLLGITDVAQDFASKVKSRDMLNWSLKYSGFRGMDRLGKNTFINSAMRKNQQLSKEDFLNKWRPVFGQEADSLYDQVQTFSKIDPSNKDTVGFMLWNELADVQPISLSQLPKRYLQHPDGRMAYMLQTFTLKLFDLMRRDIVQPAQQGNYGRAAKNAGMLSTLFVTMNGTTDAAKQFVLTGEVDDATQLVMGNYLKMVGMNPYMITSIQREGAGSALLKTLGPPTALPDAVTDIKKATKLIPIAGKFIAEGIPE